MAIAAAAATSRLSGMRTHSMQKFSCHDNPENTALPCCLCCGWSCTLPGTITDVYTSCGHEGARSRQTKSTATKQDDLTWHVKIKIICANKFAGAGLNSIDPDQGQRFLSQQEVLLPERFTRPGLTICQNETHLLSQHP